MPRLVSRGPRRLRVSTRRALRLKDVLISIRDNSQAINSHSRNRNDRGLLLSSQGPNPMDLPLYTRVRRSWVVVNRLQPIQVHTTALRYNLSQYQRCSNNSNSSLPESQPMRWSKIWIECESAPRPLLPTLAFLDPLHQMVTQMKSQAVSPLELQLGLQGPIPQG